MFYKRDTIIIDKDLLEEEIESLHNELANFFANDDRFGNSVEVRVSCEYEECRCEECGGKSVILSILVFDGSKVEKYKKKKLKPCMVIFDTLSMETHFAMDNGVPKFYLLFEFADFSSTDRITWERNEMYDENTVENIVLDFLEKKYGC